MTLRIVITVLIVIIALLSNLSKEKHKDEN